MATAFWRGVVGTARTPSDGLFGTAANWRDGMVPDADTDVFFTAGSYVVQARSSAEIQSASIGAGVTLKIGGAQTIVLFTLDDASTNYGTIALAAGQVSLANSTSLTNFGLIATSLAGDGSSAIQNGAIFNFGLIETLAANSSISVISQFRNEAGGEIAARNGAINLGGRVQNDGLIGAYGGNTVRISGFDDSVRTLSNFSGSVLTGGQWIASDNGSSLLASGGGSIAQLRGGADVTLGVGARFGIVQGDRSIVEIDSSLRMIGAGSALRLGEGRSFVTGNPLEVAGTLSLAGGTVAGPLKVGTGAVLSGYGTVAQDATIDGSVIVGADDGAAAGRLVLGGATTVTGTVSGKGTIIFAGEESTIERNAAISSAGLEVNHGSLSVESAIVYRGALTLDHADLDLVAITLKLGGTATIIDSHVTGRADRVLTFTHGANFSGTSEVDVGVRATGQVSIDGSATFDAGVYGNASFTLGADATLEFGAAVSGTAMVAMAGDGGTLRLDAPGTFRAHLTQFGAGDTIALADVDAASRLAWRGDADGAGGTLIIVETDGRLALRFDDGAYAQRDFHLAAGAGGEALLTYGAPAQHVASDHLAAAEFWMPAGLIHSAHEMLV